MDTKLTRRELFDRVSDFESFGYSNTQVANAMGLSPALITEIQSHPDYVAILAEKSGDRMERAKTLADSWDMVEALSLQTVAQTLHSNPDPDYALKAAALANKASRRGPNGNVPIVGGSANGVIKLNVNFIQQFNLNVKETLGSNESPQNGTKSTTIDMPINDIEAIQQHALEDNRKVTNMMTPDEVEKIFDMAENDREKEEENMLPYHALSNSL